MDREGGAGSGGARDWYERAFRTFLHRAYESPLRGRYTLEYLREYRANESLDAAALRALQWRRLQSLLRHCWDHVPFYRRHWAGAIADPAELRAPEDLARLPVLERRDVQAAGADLFSRVAQGPLVHRRTDGTTGPPVDIAYSRVDYERRQALILRGYGWAGYAVGGRAAFLWGEPASRAPGLRGLRERLHHALFNRVLLDATRLGEADLAAHAARLRGIRPGIVVGYAGALHALSRWLLDTGTRVPRPRVVLSAAEPLAPAQRDTIARAFGAPVRNTYGCREFSLVAAEHAACGHIHVNADHLFVEAAPGPAPGLDRLLVTDLLNHAMPLVRYATGDLGELSRRACPCGLPFPTLDEVAGRESDALWLPDGGLLHAGALHDAALRATDARQVQFAQRGAGTVEARVAAARFDDAAAARLVEALDRAAAGRLAFVPRRVAQATTAEGGKTPLVERSP